MDKNPETLIREMLAKLEKLTYGDEDELDDLRRKTRLRIKKIFGEESNYLEEEKKVAFISNVRPDLVKEQKKINKWDKGNSEYKNLLNTILEDLQLSEKFSAKKQEYKKQKSNKIFVVHGHKETMRETVARNLEKLGFEPIILHEEANQGKTIIEKFTHYSDVAFAVVILSGDDYGYSKEDEKEPVLRPRQNVILEMGYFLGKLGRDKVFCLYEKVKNLEIPSDYQGVILTPFDNEWKYKLAKELKEAGFEIEVNKIL